MTQFFSSYEGIRAYQAPLHCFYLDKFNIFSHFKNIVYSLYRDFYRDDDLTFKLEFVDSGLYFVQDENNFINPLLQVESNVHILPEIRNAGYLYH